MSYRTYVNGVQLFGNNEYYPEWIDFVKTQGAQVSEDGVYSCAITDFDGAMKAVQSITKRLVEEYRIQQETSLREIDKILAEDPEDKELLEMRREWEPSVFDLGYIRKKFDPSCVNLFDALYDVLTSHILFLPWQLYDACRDKLVRIPPEKIKSTYRIRRYKIKPSETILCSAG